VTDYSPDRLPNNHGNCSTVASVHSSIVMQDMLINSYSGPSTLHHVVSNPGLAQPPSVRKPTKEILELGEAGKHLLNNQPGQLTCPVPMRTCCTSWGKHLSRDHMVLQQAQQQISKSGHLRAKPSSDHHHSRSPHLDAYP